MAVKAQFSPKKFEEYLAQCQQLAMDEVFKTFAFLAEECVNRVRDRSADDSWIDHSGNLRSSIGYIITVNGEIAVKGGFKPTNAPDGNGSEGQKTGADYAQSLVSRFSSTPLALVVVAGMEYAVFVEARDNKDVLAATELWARAEWKRREPQLKAKIENGWKKLAQQMNIA